MSTKLTSLVEKIHASPLKCAIVTTGAGGTAISMLMSVPGCSKTLLDGNVPYHRNALCRVLDHHPQSFVSRDVGRELAQYAHSQGVKIVGCSGEGPGGAEGGAELPLTADEEEQCRHVFGVGCTAAIQTDRTRRGLDALHVSSWSHDEVVDYALVMSKDRTRAEQELVVAKVILRAVADCAGISFAGHIEDDGCDAFLAKPREVPSEIFSEEKKKAADAEVETLVMARVPLVMSPFALLLAQKVRCVVFNTHGNPHVNVEPYTQEDFDHTDTIYLLYPGSFQPLHWGHTELARVACEVMSRYRNAEEGTAATIKRYTTKKVVLTYEISADIVGKGALKLADCHERTHQFTSTGRRVALTCAKLFVEKAKMFPGHGLIMGVDTARRVIDPHYYNDDANEMLAKMKEIDSVGGYFVVGGRRKDDGTWDDYNSMLVPDAIKHMFRPIHESDFRVDISSTEIRARRRSNKED